MLMLFKIHPASNKLDNFREHRGKGTNTIKHMMKTFWEWYPMYCTQSLPEQVWNVVWLRGKIRLTVVRGAYTARTV